MEFSMIAWTIPAFALLIKAWEEHFNYEKRFNTIHTNYTFNWDDVYNPPKEVIKYKTVYEDKIVEKMVSPFQIGDIHIINYDSFTWLLYKENGFIGDLSFFEINKIGLTLYKNPIEGPMEEETWAFNAPDPFHEQYENEILKQSMDHSMDEIIFILKHF